MVLQLFCLTKGAATPMCYIHTASLLCTYIEVNCRTECTVGQHTATPPITLLLLGSVHTQYQVVAVSEYEFVVKRSTT